MWGHCRRGGSNNAPGVMLCVELLQTSPNAAIKAFVCVLEVFWLCFLIVETVDSDPSCMNFCKTRFLVEDSILLIEHGNRNPCVNHSHHEGSGSGMFELCKLYRKKGLTLFWAAKKDDCADTQVEATVAVVSFRRPRFRIIISCPLYCVRTAI